MSTHVFRKRPSDIKACQTYPTPSASGLQDLFRMLSYTRNTMRVHASSRVCKECASTPGFLRPGAVGWALSTQAKRHTHTRLQKQAVLKKQFQFCKAG